MYEMDSVASEWLLRISLLTELFNKRFKRQNKYRGPQIIFRLLPLFFEEK
jgi:hypothetical protein